MAAELVNGATSEKLAETDWTKNIEICELVAHDKRYPKISFPYSVLFLSDWTMSLNIGKWIVDANCMIVSQTKFI